MHTPVPIIGRGVEKEFVLDGVTLPMGCAVEVNVHALHHNETVWGEDHNVNIYICNRKVHSIENWTY